MRLPSPIFVSCEKIAIRRFPPSDQTCGPNFEWSECATACPATCRRPLAPATCNLLCAPGCQCKAGFVQHDAQCIAASQCPTSGRRRRKRKRLSDDAVTSPARDAQRQFRDLIQTRSLTSQSRAVTERKSTQTRAQTRTRERRKLSARPAVDRARSRHSLQPPQHTSDPDT